MRLLNVLAITIVLFAAVASAQTVEISKPETKDKAAAQAAYQVFLDKVKSGDTSIDFKAMRLAFAETKGAYKDDGLLKKMNEASAAKDNKKAIKTATDVLNGCYVNIKAHVVAYNAYKQMGQETEATFHNKVALGLINSIIEDGDGGSPKTAWTVIDVAEEYSVLSVMGYSVKSQALQTDDGHRYDVMTTENNKTKETATFYFNVDIIFAAYGGMLNPKK